MQNGYLVALNSGTTLSSRSNSFSLDLQGPHARRGRCFFHIGLGQGGKKGEEGDAPRRNKKFKFHDDSYFGDTSSNATLCIRITIYPNVLLCSSGPLATAPPRVRAFSSMYMACHFDEPNYLIRCLSSDNIV
jgi:hypothetical protein